MPASRSIHLAVGIIDVTWEPGGNVATITFEANGESVAVVAKKADLEETSEILMSAYNQMVAEE